MTEPGARRRLLAILAADAAAYSRLMAADDRGTLATLDAAREAFREYIVAHGGRVIDMAGDSILAVFDVAEGSVHAAMEVQKHLANEAKSVAADRRMDFRIGVHLGDVIEKADGSVYGDGVNVAARLQSLAEPGGVVVSQAIQGAVGSRAQATFVDLGEHQVKNIPHPVRAFRCMPLSQSSQRAVTLVGAASPTPSARTRSPRLVTSAIVAVLLILAASAWLAMSRVEKPVAPYSAADQRMTFALLPIEAQKGDPEGARLAEAAGDAVQALQEERILWARVSPRALVARAATEQPTLQQLGAALGVHFLLRGTVLHEASSYVFNLAIVDAATARVLDTKALQVGPPNAPMSERRAIDAALETLTYDAVRAEVERARDKPEASLDVRDLTFRATVDWRDGRDAAGSYAKAKASLDRALTLAPDDLLALKITAELNVCTCQRAWAKNTDEMERLGVAALDRFLAIRPNTSSMLNMRSEIFFRHRRYEEALLVAEDVLRRDPQSDSTLFMRTMALLKLRRFPSALAAAQTLLTSRDDAAGNSLAATVHYAAGSDEMAIRLAQLAISQMTRGQLADPDLGSVALTLIAAEARAGHLDRARAALAHFYSDVPDVRTIGQVKSWLPADALELDDEARFDGLRLAGMAD